MDDVVEVKVFIAARPATVYRFLSEPEYLRRWLGEGTTLDKDRLLVPYPNGDVAEGTIREAVPDRKIVFGWGYRAGRRDLPPDESQVTIELSESKGGTLVTLRHEGLPPGDRAGHRMGWSYYTAVLAAEAASLQLEPRLSAAVESYVAAWNETDPGARQKLLEGCLEADATYRDRYAVAVGRPALGDVIANAQRATGARLELDGRPDSCHDTVRFAWQVRLPQGAVMARGTSFGRITLDGRFAELVGFWNANATGLS